MADTAKLSQQWVDGTAFGHVGQPSTPIDDEIERGLAPTWPILAIRYIRGDAEVVRAVNRFVKARTKLRELVKVKSPLEDSIFTVQGEYAAARSALDRMADGFEKLQVAPPNGGREVAR